AINGILTPDQVADWGWRLAFGIGGLLGLYALYLRRFITESEHFTAAQQDTTDETIMSAPSGVLAHWRGLLIIFTISAGGSLMFYTWLIYLPTHAQVAHGMTPTSTLTASLIAQSVFLVAIVGAGLLGDRIGRRPMIIAFGLAFLVLPFPLFGMLDGSFWGLLAAQLVALLAVALLFGVNGAVWSEVLTLSVRAKGVATMLSLATAIFGGTAPYVITWLSGHDLLTVFLTYLMVVAVATGVTGMVMRETRGSDLSA
ncbi:MFS transporter, partial [Micrococcaceae sp. AOP34-BR2-30]